MAKKSASIQVYLELLKDKFEAELDKSESKMAGFAKKGSVGLAAVGAAGFAAYKLASPMIGFASDMNEELSKSETVFGSAAKGLHEFADSAAESAGLSKVAALEFGNQFGQFGKAADLTGSDISDFAVSLTQLSADLGSFNNIGSDDAAQKLLSGLSGSSEPLRELGVFINAAQVEAKGLEMGLGGATGKLTDQEKVLARYALIMEQTTDAQGDFVNTSDGLANQQKIMAANWENIQAELGEKLLPVMLNVVTFINEDLLPGMEELAAWLSEEIPQAVEETRKYWEPAFAIMESTATIVFEALSLLVNIFKGDWDEAWGNIKRIFSAWWDSVVAHFVLGWAIITNMFSTVIGWFADVGSSIAGAIGDLSKLLYWVGRDIIVGLWDGIASKWSWLTDKIGGIVGSIKDGFKSGFGLWSPSRVMIEMGGYLMDGLAIGMQRGVTVPIHTAGNVSAEVLHAFSPRPGSFAGNGGGQPSTVIVHLDGRELLKAQLNANDLTGGVVNVRARAS